MTVILAHSSIYTGGLRSVGRGISVLEWPGFTSSLLFQGLRVICPGLSRCTVPVHNLRRGAWFQSEGLGQACPLSRKNKAQGSSLCHNKSCFFVVFLTLGAAQASAVGRWLDLYAVNGQWLERSSGTRLSDNPNRNNDLPGKAVKCGNPDIYRKPRANEMCSVLLGAYARNFAKLRPPGNLIQTLDGRRFSSGPVWWNSCATLFTGSSQRKKQQKNMTCWWRKTVRELFSSSIVRHETCIVYFTMRTLETS